MNVEFYFKRFQFSNFLNRIRRSLYDLHTFTVRSLYVHCTFTVRSLGICSVCERPRSPWPGLPPPPRDRGARSGSPARELRRCPPAPPTLILSAVTPRGADRTNIRAFSVRAFNIKVGGRGGSRHQFVLAPRCCKHVSFNRLNKMSKHRI